MQFYELLMGLSVLCWVFDTRKGMDMECGFAIPGQYNEI